MSIVVKIFDKTHPNLNGIYGTIRFKNDAQLTEVKHNHSIIVKEMGANNMLMLNHVFGDRIIDADLVTDFSEEPDADAAVTTQPGILLSIQTADCVPIMLASEDDLVIGAAHCSWHTTKDDILKKLVQAMQNKGAKNIRAIIGPAIHQKSYEVSQSFYLDMIASEPNAEKFFIASQKPGHHMFDLPAFCVLKLEQLGITKLINYCEDTYAHPEKYYSYRRDVHLGIVGERTNILSTIMIKK